MPSLPHSVVRPALRASWRPLVLALTLATWMPVASAADALTTALQDAYAPYRAALFRTNGTSIEEARQAVQQARGAWDRLLTTTGSRAPAPYDRDPSLNGALEQVSKVYRKAQEEVDAGRLPAAHETLEEIRDVLGELRRRNQVVVFSDHMNAYHAQMETVLVEGPKLLAGGAWQDLAMAVGALDWLAGRLDSEADAGLKANTEFTELLGKVRSSVAKLRTAVRAQDAARTREALGQVKAPYSRLFLKFG